MTNKSFILSLVSVVFAIFLVSAVSAASLSHTITSVPTSIAHDAGSFTVSFTLTNTGVDASPMIWTYGVTSGSATIAVPTDTSLGANETKTFTATVSFTSHQSGNLAFTITADPNGAGSNEVMSFSVPITDTPSLSIASTKALNKTQNGTITVTNTGNTNVNINLSASGDISVAFSPQNTISLIPGQTSSPISVNSLTDLSSLKLGSHTADILGTDLNSNVTGTLTYSSSKDFCNNGNVNTSSVSIDSVEDKDSNNDWEWKPLDSIRVQVEVSNNLDRDEDFGVELAVYDTQKHTFIELDGDSTMSDTVSINQGDSEKVDFEFKAPTDVDDSDGGRYLVYAKAYVDGRESSICTSNHFADLQISKKSRDVVLDELSDLDLVRPGDTVTVTARMFNTGSEDEDKVKTILTNTKLGINLESNSVSLDQGDSNIVSFTFTVPTTAQNGVYYLTLINYFNYKSSSDSYTRSSDSFEVKLTVVDGTNSVTTGKNAGISALLASNAKAGGQMEVTSTIRNNANQRLSFVVGPTNYESWASLNRISDRIVTLNAGESKDITMVFDINKDATGQHTFTIEATSGSVVDSKDVVVDVTGDSIWSNITGTLGNNGFLWAVGIINAILVIFIIIIAVRILRR